MKAFYEKFSRILEDVSKTNYNVLLEPPLWEVPRQKQFGDLSTMIALKIASRQDKEPLEVAAQIKQVVAEKMGKDFSRIEVVKPGFVNLFLSPDGLRRSLNSIIKDKDNFFRQKRHRKVLMEFVSANPTGPLSIAHGRQAVVGDVIARVMEFLGNEVMREYYVNDEGRQITLLIQSVEARIKEINGEESSFPEDGYHGEYIKDIAAAASSVKKEDLRDFVLNYLLSLIRKDLNDLDIKFDNWFSQRDLISGKFVERAIEELKKKGLIYEKEGALWFSSSRFGDDKDRVIRKKDGELTYFASDIAYHRDKIKRGYGKLINLWGPDHHGYIPRVKAAIKGMGYDPDILDVVIIQLVTVKTRERMSRRRGTVVLLSELIKEVGPAAARFYYLLRRNSSPLEFDIDLAKTASFDNPLYYVQYAHTRIVSIFRKAGVKELSPSFTKFLTEEELDLVRDILQFGYCLDKIYYHLEPVFLIEYLKSIASCFHKFYERTRVLGDTDKRTQAKLNLLEGFRVVIDCGLRLLGIEPLTEM